jgi:DNA polymerase-3 subunit delta'
LTETLPEHLLAATERQPGARAALAAALAAGPSHAYLFAGPGGSGMRDAARAFAAELIADGAPDPESARRRALAEPSPHPDLVWLRPPGAQHLVEEVREQVIKGIAYRPFEGERRVFVIEAAEAMADESQNALLRTLEEPPAFAHLLLLSSEPEGLRATVTSRCQWVRFAALTPDAIEEVLSGPTPEGQRGLTPEGHVEGLSRMGSDPSPEGQVEGLSRPGSDPSLRAAARLAGGDVDRARFLLTEPGAALRAAVERWTTAIRSDQLAEAPWAELLALAEEQGGEAAAETERAIRERAEESGGAAAKRGGRDAQAAGRRAGRKRRTEVLDLSLALLGASLRDLAAVGEGAPDLVLNADRRPALQEAAGAVDPRRARRAAELVLEARRRLRVNVSEELALEALSFRAAYLLSSS